MTHRMLTLTRERHCRMAAEIRLADALDGEPRWAELYLLNGRWIVLADSQYGGCHSLLLRPRDIPADRSDEAAMTSLCAALRKMGVR